MATPGRRIVVAALLAASLLCGCTTVRGSNSDHNVALVFYEAVASGDVGRAQAVTAVPITAADLTDIRKGLFGTEATLTISAVHVDTGAEEVDGRGPLYKALYDYRTVGGVVNAPGDDAFSRYQLAVERRGAVWVVLSWVTPWSRK